MQGLQLPPSGYQLCATVYTGFATQPLQRADIAGKGSSGRKVLRHGDWSHRIVYGLDHARSKITNLYDGRPRCRPRASAQALSRHAPDQQRAVCSGRDGVWRLTITPLRCIDHFRHRRDQPEPVLPPAPSPASRCRAPQPRPSWACCTVPRPHGAFCQYATGYRAPEAGQVNDRFEAVAWA